MILQTGKQTPPMIAKNRKAVPPARRPDSPPEKTFLGAKLALVSETMVKAKTRRKNEETNQADILSTWGDFYSWEKNERPILDGFMAFWSTPAAG
jgi:hypothetical protein